MFQPAKDFLLLATKKYQLDAQAVGSLVCERARQLIAKKYPKFTEAWQPQKFKAGSLTVRATGGSGGELFMHTQTLLEELNKMDLPQSVQQIKIVKG